MCESTYHASNTADLSASPSNRSDNALLHQHLHRLPERAECLVDVGFAVRRRGDATIVRQQVNPADLQILLEGRNDPAGNALQGGGVVAVQFLATARGRRRWLLHVHVKYGRVTIDVCRRAE